MSWRTSDIRKGEELGDKECGGGELVVLNDTVSLVHAGGGGEFLAVWCWGGLEQQLGLTGVQGEVVMGYEGGAWIRD